MDRSGPMSTSVWVARRRGLLGGGALAAIAALSMTAVSSGCVDDGVCEDLTRSLEYLYTASPQDMITDVHGHVYVVWNDSLLDETMGVIAAYDAAGAVRWTQQITPDDLHRIWLSSIATGPDGDLFVFGERQSGETGKRDAFIARYGTDGTERGILYRSDTKPVIDLAIDPSGNLYVVHRTWSAQSSDLLLAKYNPDGAQQWTRILGTTEDEQPHAVATDANGNVYVTGRTEGVFDQPGATKWSDDAFVAKFSTSGTLRWVRQLETPEDDAAHDVTTDDDGNVFITGYTHTSIDDQEYRGHGDAFVRKYDSAGAVLWTRLFGTPVTDHAQYIKADAGGSVYISGWTEGAIDGSQWVRGYDDGFLTTFDAAGTRGHTMQFGTPGHDYAVGVSVGYDGNVYTLNRSEEILYGFNPSACAP